MKTDILLSRAFVCTFAGLAFGVSGAAVQASDWAEWRGPNRNGISRETELALKWPEAGPKQLWKINTGLSYSAVTVKDGKLYTLGSAEGKDTLFCLDAETGKTVWKHVAPHPERKYMGDPNPTSTTSTPVLEGDYVYVLSREGIARCLNAEDGKVVWERDVRKEAQAGLPPWGFAGSPLIVGEKVIFNVGHHGIALNKTTGSVLWKSSGGVAGYTTPVLYTQGAKKGVAFCNGTGVVGADLETGEPFWEHTWKTRFDVNATDPVFYGEEFFLTTNGRAQRVRVANNKPEVVVEVRNMQNTFVNPVLLDGYLYGNNKGRLTCTDLKTDEIKWDIPNMGGGALIAAGKHLLALSERGEVIVVEANPAKLTEIARAKVLEGTCWTMPTLANGRLYCRSVQGDIVCLDLKK